MNLLNVNSQISDELSRNHRNGTRNERNVALVRSRHSPIHSGSKALRPAYRRQPCAIPSGRTARPAHATSFHAENTREAETLTYLNRHLDFKQARNCLYETSDRPLQAFHTPIYKQKTENLMAEPSKENPSRKILPPMVLIKPIPDDMIKLTRPHPRESRKRTLSSKATAYSASIPTTGTRSSRRWIWIPMISTTESKPSDSATANARTRLPRRRRCRTWKANPSTKAIPSSIRSNQFQRIPRATPTVGREGRSHPAYIRERSQGQALGNSYLTYS